MALSLFHELRIILGVRVEQLQIMPSHSKMAKIKHIYSNK